jgi:hypothetical protein
MSWDAETLEAHDIDYLLDLLEETPGAAVPVDWGAAQLRDAGVK